MTTPRILHLDIETAPASYYIWNPYTKENLPISQMIRPGRMLMWGAKWDGDKRVLQADERKGVKPMLKELHGLMSEADMIVSYNGDNFDIPWITGGIVQHDLGPLPPVASLDLYKTVKKLRYQSSKLEYIAPLLGIGEKVKNAGFSLWRGVLTGDKKSWKEMLTYNRGDITLLEQGYARLRPYIKNHPRLFDKQKGAAVCPVCGSTHVQFKGTYRTLENKFHRFVCTQCGKWGKVAKLP